MQSPALALAPVPVVHHRRRAPHTSHPMRKRARMPALSDDTWDLIYHYVCQSAAPFRLRPPAPEYRLKASVGLTLLSMVNRAFRARVGADTATWLRLLHEHQIAYFGRYKLLFHSAQADPLPGVDGLYVSPPPNFGFAASPARLYFRQRANGVDPPDWPAVCPRAPAEFTDAQTRALVAHSRKLLRVAHIPRCGACGARGRGTPFWMLDGGIRVCDACRADRFVSNAALYAECGVDFWRELPRLAAAGVFFHTADVHLETTLNRCSLSAHDRVAAAAAVARRETPTLVFFWRPHLEALYGPLCDLAQLARCPARAAAGERLRGFARALFTRLAIAQGGKPIRVTTSHLFYMSEPGQRRERDLVGLHGSTSYVHYPSEIGKGNATRERARIAVQAAFLAHAGRSTLPRVRGRGRRRATVAQLRLLEVRRATAAPWYPQFSVAPAFELRHLFNQACASVQEPFRAPGAGREAAVEYIEVSDD